MWKNILLFLVFASCLPCAAQDADPGRKYWIAESQLQSIEQLIQQLESSRQNWESQAHGLKSEAEILNNQLAAEREQYSELQKSYNKYETSQLKAQAEWNTKFQKEQLKNKKIETQRNIVIFAAAILLVLYLIKLKFKIP
jgi:chromosome segregation ATPase